MSESSSPSTANATTSGVRARLALVVATLAVAAIILFTSMPSAGPITDHAPDSPPPPPDARVDPTPVVNTPTVLGGDATGEAPAGHTTRSLTEPPAGLPVYDGATLLLGVEREIPNWIERQTVYRVRDTSIDPAALATWYVNAAVEKGWTERNAPATTALNRVLSRDGQTMTITARGTDRDVRVTLLFRESTE